MNCYALNILIADSNEREAEFLSEAVRNILPSSNCILTPNGIAAIEFLKSNPNLAPDLVFLDMDTALKNGIECLKEIEELKLLPNTPIAITASRRNRKNIETAYRLGAQFYIIKPPSLNELKRIIKQAVAILGKPLSERTDESNFVLKEMQTEYAVKSSQPVNVSQ